MTKTASKKLPETTLKRDVSSMRKVLANRLYELRTAADLSQAALADRKSTRLNSSHIPLSRMPSSA